MSLPKQRRLPNSSSSKKSRKTQTETASENPPAAGSQNDAQLLDATKRNRLSTELQTLQLQIETLAKANTDALIACHTKSTRQILQALLYYKTRAYILSMETTALHHKYEHEAALDAPTPATTRKRRTSKKK